MFSKRIEKVTEKLNKGEAFLVLSEVNRLYFSGFKSSAGAVLVTKASAYFFTDFRYFEKAKCDISHLKVCLSKKLYSEINEILIAENIKNLFIETDYVNLDNYSALKLAMTDTEISNDSKLCNYTRLLRSIKSTTELEAIKKAQALTDKTFLYILDFISAGKTEKQIALEMEFFMRKQGSEGVSFDFIVVSGKNSSLPHGVPCDKLIQKGDFITMDFGAVINGYHSDMTRTVALGEISEKQRFIYNTVLSAQEKALSEIAPNRRCCDIDKTARDVISLAGFGDCFGHGLGHSVGLEIHEGPSFNTRDETLLTEGMVLTVEPGIYLENEFGVRIEDMVAITEKDYVNLTESPKDLIIL